MAMKGRAGEHKLLLQAHLCFQKLFQWQTMLSVAGLVGTDKAAAIVVCFGLAADHLPLGAVS